MEKKSSVHQRCMLENGFKQNWKLSGKPSILVEEQITNKGVRTSANLNKTIFVLQVFRDHLPEVVVGGSCKKSNLAILCDERHGRYVVQDIRDVRSHFTSGDIILKIGGKMMWPYTHPSVVQRILNPLGSDSHEEVEVVVSREDSGTIKKGTMLLHKNGTATLPGYLVGREQGRFHASVPGGGERGVRFFVENHTPQLKLYYNLRGPSCYVGSCKCGKNYCGMTSMQKELFWGYMSQEFRFLGETCAIGSCECSENICCLEYSDDEQVFFPEIDDQMKFSDLCVEVGEDIIEREN